MASPLIEAIGWLGAAMIVVAYLLITSKRMKPNSLVYQALNLVGAILLGANAFLNGALPSATMNVMWVIIAVYGMTRIASGRRVHHAHPRAH